MHSRMLTNNRIRIGGFIAASAPARRASSG
jgi:hypothetical protein